MVESLMIVRLDADYCDYLREFDERVPFNYGKKKTRPFVGVLFMVNDCMYFAPISSPKPKHLKIKSKLDILKLKDGKLGAINFNNMLPVTKNNIIIINLDKDCNDKREEKYFKLLKEQLFWLNRNSEKLFGRSKKLYEKYVDGTLDVNIAKRCCNFKILEEKYREYNGIKE